MLARERAVRIALAEARAGVREKTENVSKRIKQYQGADSTPGTGYAWCNSFVVWCYREAGRVLEETGRSAGVKDTATLGTKAGWAVRKPARGDLVCFQIDDDVDPDHIGIVVDVPSDSLVRTVEGNTVGDSGGEGVFVKTRARETCALFLRVPGEVADGIGRGDHGDDVRELQKQLVKLGHKKIEVDGEFGEATEAAVGTFQAKHSLPKTGVASPKTVIAIAKDIEPPVPEPKPEPTPPGKPKPAFVVTAAFSTGRPKEVAGLSTRTALNKQVNAFLDEGARFVQISPDS